MMFGFLFGGKEKVKAQRMVKAHKRNGKRVKAHTRTVVVSEPQTTRQWVRLGDLVEVRNGRGWALMEVESVSSGRAECREYWRGVRTAVIRPNGDNWRAG